MSFCVCARISLSCINQQTAFTRRCLWMSCLFYVYRRRDTLLYPFPCRASNNTHTFALSTALILELCWRLNGSVYGREADWPRSTWAQMLGNRTIAVILLKSLHLMAADVPAKKRTKNAHTGRMRRPGRTIMNKWPAIYYRRSWKW